MGKKIKLKVIHTKDYDPLEYYLASALEKISEYEEGLFVNHIYANLVQTYALYKEMLEVGESE